MILKQKDDRTEDIQELNRLLGLNISSKQRFLIERELKCLMSGSSGESSSAYYLNFRFQQSKNWAVIHDLRIEHQGLVAQIDHLLINRLLDIHVLESKNYFYGIKITDDGEFLSYNGKGYQGIESPIEQNKRHIELLQKIIEDRNLAPTRLGLSIPISFKNYVLVAPTARIDRPVKKTFDTSMVVKADGYASHIEKKLDDRSVISVFASVAKIVGTDTLEGFADKLINLHKPGEFNYTAKFGIDEKAVQPVQNISPRPPAKPQEQCKSIPCRTCEQCGAGIEEKVAYYCRINKAKFNGKSLCQTCQKSPAPIQLSQQQSPIKDAGGKSTSCESCGVIVDGKVVYFCRMNKKKFDNKVLCRNCQ
jgi:hypothetical protein